ncbi:MAG TPA: ROK family transcriptional regulator [Candidatus Dormibacteraeota bacterium]|nr:ROK family transcriptional regulator [Candidatus Dormibacteraeota bacterium]
MSSGQGGGSLTELRLANRRKALRLLRLKGALTQAEISRSTGLSHAAVSNIVRELVDSGLARATSASRNGRRVSEVTLNPSSGIVGGIDFGNHHVRVAIADRTHTVLAEEQHTLPYGHAAASGVREAADMVSQLTVKARRHMEDMQLLVVGLPGPIESGRTVSPAILPGWSGFDVKSAFAAALGVPTMVDNDANLGALAEGIWGVGQGLSDFAYIKVSTGIGAGLVLNGRLYRGVAGTAGEIGHTTIEEDGLLCRCGNRGCLETLAAAPALLDLLRRTYKDTITIEDVLRLGANGDTGCRRLIADAGRHIGVALANLCNLLSPQLIIVGGELALAGDVLIDPVRESMSRRAVSTPTPPTRVVTGVLSERAGVLGALALALQESDEQNGGAMLRAALSINESRVSGTLAS